MLIAELWKYDSKLHMLFDIFVVNGICNCEVCLYIPGKNAVSQVVHVPWPGRYCSF